jgi:IclR family transcriptional regulator, KDG regulon repressor
MDTVKSLTKTLKIIDVIINNDGEMALGDIAESSGFSKTATSRIVSTLLIHGVLKQKNRRGKYSLGPGFLTLTRNSNKSKTISHYSFLDFAEFSRITGETIFLALWKGSESIGSRSVDISTGVLHLPIVDWLKMPLHGTCIGKIILADMSKEELKKYFSSMPLVKHTPNTIVDLKIMENQLVNIRRDGFAIEDEEMVIGVRGLAARIKDSEGETIGAVFINGPCDRLNSLVIKKFAQSLKRCALDISRELGYHA